MGYYLSLFKCLANVRSPDCWVRERQQQRFIPPMGQTCLATNQIVAGCEKLLKKIVSSSTALRNLQKPDLLQDRFDSRMVRRTKQVARFCCQFHRSLNKFAGHALPII